MFSDFLRTLGVVLSVVWTALASFLYFSGHSILFKEVIIGCFLPVVCFIPGFYAVSWSINRPLHPFMIAVFGGMFIRLTLIGTIFVLLATLTQLHIPSLLFSLVGFYTLCLGVELY